MSTSAIRASGLTRRAGEFLLDSVDLELPTGYVMGLVGPNGAGKTTTIKAILGMIMPQSGTVELLGQPAHPSAAAINERIGVVLDQPIVTPEWKVAGLSRNIGRFYRDWDDQRFTDLMRRFGIPVNSTVGRLSRGQGMKLSIAMALAHSPDLLILDEPTSGLDPVSRSELIDILREFMVADGHSVLFSTHITSDLDGLADYIQIIDNGRTVYHGTLDELHNEFGFVHGVEDLSQDSSAAILGMRRTSNGFEGLIRTRDSHLFGAGTEIDAATTDDVIVHLARNTRTREAANS